jgi:hypothetical protein
MPVRVAMFGVLAIVCVGLAAVLGWRAGSATTSRTPTVSGDSRAMRLGPAHLTLPVEWTPVNPASALLPGLDPSLTHAFEVVPGLSGNALLSLAAPADRSLIPSSLRRLLKAAPGTPRSTLLAGHSAWSYLTVATLRRGTVMDITVLPTSAGVLAVACVAARAAFEVVAGCERDVQRVSVPGARMLAPSPGVAFSLRVGPALERLNHLRGLGGRALRAARSQGAQARALRAVAIAYTGAADGLAPLAPGNGAPAGLVAALRDAARAYQVTGAAAAAGAYRDYTAGRTAVRAAEAGVSAALARVAAARR